MVDKAKRYNWQCKDLDAKIVMQQLSLGTIRTLSSRGKLVLSRSVIQKHSSGRANVLNMKFSIPNISGILQ